MKPRTKRCSHVLMASVAAIALLTDPALARMESPPPTVAAGLAGTLAQGDAAFLEAVEAALLAAPEQQADILAAARHAAPHLTASLEALAEAVGTPRAGATQLAQTPAPAAAGGAATTGAAAGAAAGVAAVIPGAMVAGMALTAIAVSAGGSEGAAPEPAWFERSAGTADPAIADRFIADDGDHAIEHFELSSHRTDELEGLNPYEVIGLAAGAYARGLTGAGQIIAILDESFDLEHPEYADRIIGTYDEATIRSDEADPYHGTFVAGLAAAALNGEGIHGVAHEASLHLAPYFGIDGFTAAQWAAATNAAGEAGAVVQNNSWGIDVALSPTLVGLLSDPTGRFGDLPEPDQDQIAAYIDQAGIDLADIQDNLPLYLEVVAGGLGQNLSTAAQWSDYLDALRGFQDQGVVIFALSNLGSLPHADLSAALPVMAPDLMGAWIAVSNVDITVRDDDDPVIRRYSAACHNAAPFCLIHDGSWLVSTAVGGGITVEPDLGTSYAAPQVAGAIALLAQAFPDHAPEQLVTRLLATARNFQDWDVVETEQGWQATLIEPNGDESTVLLTDDPGATGLRDFGNGISHTYSATYGHGLMDLDAALQPIGPVQALQGRQAASAQRLSLGDTRMQLGPAFGDGLATTLSGLSFLGFDALNGGFPVPLGQFVRTANARLDGGALLRDFAFERRPDRVVLGHDGWLEASFRSASGDRLRGPDPARAAGRSAAGPVLAELAFRQQLGAGSAAGMTVNRAPGRSFGLQAEGLIETAYLSDRNSFANPLMSFATQGHAFTVEQRLGGDALLRLGAFEGQHPEEAEIAAWGTAAELALPIRSDRLRLGGLALQGGLLTERGSVLGSRSAGAFDLSGDTATLFAGLSADVALDGIGLTGLRLVGAAHWGWTRPRTAAASFIQDISTVQSDAYSLGLVGDGLVSAGDRWGLVVSQPLRVASGQANLRLTDGIGAGGWLQHREVAVGLAPSGRETRLEAFHATPLGAGVDLAGSVMLRNEPGHVRGAAADGVGMIKLHVRF